MSRTLVIGDIHGAFKALEQVLERANVTTDDTLIFLGDYVDGWSQPVEVINKLIDLKSSHNCVFIKGNHDELFYDWLQKEKDNPDWVKHGGQATLDAYSDVSLNFIKMHAHFLGELEDYFIDSENRLFLHAGFTNVKGVKQEYFPKMFSWDRSLWELALASRNLSQEDEFYPERLKHYKEIFIGHTPLTRINRTEPMNACNVWNVDTGAAFTNPLTIMDVDSKEFWQSEPVHLLYPDEKGRN